MKKSIKISEIYASNATEGVEDNAGYVGPRDGRKMYFFDSDLNDGLSKHMMSITRESIKLEK